MLIKENIIDEHGQVMSLPDISAVLRYDSEAYCERI